MFDDARQMLRKPIVEHAISLVNAENGQIRKIPAFRALQVVEDPSRRANHKHRRLREAIGLHPSVRPADGCGKGDSRKTPCDEALENASDLNRELPGGGEDQRKGRLARRGGEIPTEHWQEEGERLAATGWGLHARGLAGEKVWQDEGLHLGGVGVVEVLVECLQEEVVDCRGDLAKGELR